MDENKSLVYAKVDERNRITAIDGGFTIGNITDFSEWVYIDEGEGEGDRYNLCQSNYLDKPIMDERDIYQYKLVDGKPVERTQAEMDADVEPTPPSISLEERINDLETALCEIMDSMA